MPTWASQLVANNARISIDQLRKYWPGKIADVVTGFNKQRQAANKKQRLGFGASQEEQQVARNAIHEETQAFKKSAHEELDKVAAGVAQDRQFVERGISASFVTYPEPPKDSTEALLRDAKEQRAWTKVKDVLASSPNDHPNVIRTATQRALAENDHHTIAAINSELPHFARDDADKPLLVSAFEETVASARPEARQALETRKELEPGLYQLNMAISYARDAIDGEKSSVILPGWEKGKTETLSFEAGGSQ